MRYHHSMLSCPLLQEFVGAEAIFLDTTYCNPRYVFPPQEATVEYVAEQVQRALSGGGAGCAESSATPNGHGAPVNGAGEARPTAPEPQGEGDEEDEEDEEDGLQQAALADTEGGEGGMDIGKEVSGEEASGLLSEESRGQGGAGSPEGDEGGGGGGSGGGEEAGRRGGSLKGGPVVFIATYLIGKEKILLAVARRCRTRIYVDERKWKILSQLEMGAEDLAWFTTDPGASRVHVVGWGFLGDTWPYFRPNFGAMEQARARLGAERAVGFVPTGWTYELKKRTFSVRAKGQCSIHLVPYSEHSNYEELRAFVRFLRPVAVVPTVGLEGQGLGGPSAARMRKHFQTLLDDAKGKARFLRRFQRAGGVLEGGPVGEAAAGGDGDDPYPSGCTDELPVVAPQGCSGACQAGCVGPSCRGPASSCGCPQEDGGAGEEQEEEERAGNQEAGAEGQIESGTGQIDDRMGQIDDVIGQIDDGVWQTNDGMGQIDDGMGQQQENEEAEQLVLTTNGFGADQPLTGTSHDSAPRGPGEGPAPEGNGGDVKQQSTGTEPMGTGNPIVRPSVSPSPSKAKPVPRPLKRKAGAASPAPGPGKRAGGGQKSITHFFLAGSGSRGAGRRLSGSAVETNGEGTQAEVGGAHTPRQAGGLVSGAQYAGRQNSGAQVLRDQELMGQGARGQIAGRRAAEGGGAAPAAAVGRASEAAVLAVVEVLSPFVSRAEAMALLDRTLGNPDQAVSLFLQQQGQGQGTSKRPLQQQGQGQGVTGRPFQQETSVLSQGEVVHRPGDDTTGPLEDQQEPAGTREPASWEALPQTPGPEGQRASPEGAGAARDQGDRDAAKDETCRDAMSEARIGRDSTGSRVSPLWEAAGMPPLAVTQPGGEGEGSLPDELPQVSAGTREECTGAVNGPVGQGGTGTEEEALGSEQEPEATAAGVPTPSSAVCEGEPGAAGPVTLAASPVTAAACPVTAAVAAYHPAQQAEWGPGQDTPYLHLARSFEAIEKESSRLRISDILCNMFRSILALSPEDLLPALYLATNRIAPDFERAELSVGGATVAGAVAEVTGVSRQKLRELYTASGDLGDAAQQCRARQRLLVAPRALTVRHVYAALWELNRATGPGSGARKKGVVAALLRRCREVETRYLVRTLVQNMRIGAMMRTVLPALSNAVLLQRAAPGAPVSAAELARLRPRLAAQAGALGEGYNAMPDLGALLPLLLDPGVSLEAIVEKGQFIRAGTPLKPMLAKVARTAQGVVDHFGASAFCCEYKYDGRRAQIHVFRGEKRNGGLQVRVFSRTSDDCTAAFPDAAAAVLRAMQPRPAAASAEQGLLDTVAAIEGEAGVGCAAKDGTGMGRERGVECPGRESTGIEGEGGVECLEKEGTSSQGEAGAERPSEEGGGFPGEARAGSGEEAMAEHGGSSGEGEGVSAEGRQGSGAGGGGDGGEEELQELILDAEIVAVDAQTAKLLPFQKLSTRERGSKDGKGSVDPATITVMICVFVFDLLHRNGEALLKLPLRRRHELLREALPGASETACAGGVALATTLEVNGSTQMEAEGGTREGEESGPGASPAAAERVSQFLNEAIAAGCEGLMLKGLDGPRAVYEPNKRSDNWLKLKRDYIDGMADSLDLVPIGAWTGSGRKNAWFSPFLMACYNRETETFESVCRVMSGFTDAFYAETTSNYRMTEGWILNSKPVYYVTKEQPPVWFSPRQVWEIRGADLTLSPVHEAAQGMAHPERGISLRFPRFIRVRDDKCTEDASTNHDVYDLFRQQTRLET